MTTEALQATVQGLDLIEQLGDAALVTDRHRRIIAFNAVAEELYGHAAHEVMGRDASMLAPPEMADRVARDHRRALGGMTLHIDGYALTREGLVRGIGMTITPLRGADGAVTGLIVLVRDTSERMLRERQLEFMSRLVGETEAVAFIGTNRTGLVTVFNRGAEELLGYTAGEVLGRLNARDFHDRAELDQRAAELGVQPGSAEFRRVIAQRHESVWTYVRKDGSRLEVLLSVRAVIDEFNEVEGFIAMARDISEMRRAELARLRAEERFRIAFEHAPIGLAITALDGPEAGRWTQTNPALARMLGFNPGELDGQLVTDITHPDDRRRTAEAMASMRDEPVSVEKQYLRKDGSAVWVHMTATPVPSPESGRASYSVVQVIDISEQRRLERQLHHLADHDPLTGLHNRRRFEAELEQLVDQARAGGPGGALLVLDLDGFKLVNDRFGHSVGDELVAHIAGLLRQCVRKSDFIARLGGDEFAIILRDCSTKRATEVAASVLEAIRGRGLVVTPTATARVTTSIGVATYRSGTQATADEVAVAADGAMYEAKADGRNGYSVYSPGNGRHPGLPARDSWFARLRRALDEDRFVLHAQPIVPICGAGFPHYELLVRMLDDDGALVPPGAFLVNAERFDLIGEIDRWVLGRAVSLLHTHARAGNDFSLSVNISGRTMGDLDLAGDLAEMLKQSPIPASRLVVEVTETAAIVNIDRARELSEHLRALGCLFALDDFGSGFSSFYYLKHLQFDFLKIDGEFITKLVSTPNDQLLVKAVVDIARGLGTQTVAEFVGDDETVELLRRLGVDYGQGFHLGRPEPLDALLPALPEAE